MLKAHSVNYKLVQYINAQSPALAARAIASA